MANFKLFYPKLHQNEGGYANDPLDGGGETWGGVARNFWPKWAGWKIIDRYKSEFKPGTFSVPKLNALLHADAQLQDMKFQFYKLNFWNSLQLDFVDCQLLAEQLADHGVNAGPMRPAKMVQRLCKQLLGVAGKDLVVDGDIGPATITAINNAPRFLLYARFVDLRKQFYFFRAAKQAQVTKEVQLFFIEELNLRPKANQAKFLPSWLSRCVPAQLPA